MDLVLDEPYFENYAKNKFVRINVGVSKSGSVIYRLAEIKGVVENGAPSKYRVETKETRALLNLSIGKNKKNFRLDVVSNSRVTAEEFIVWKNTMEKEDCPIVSCQVARARRQASEHMRRHFVYTGVLVSFLFC